MLSQRSRVNPVSLRRARSADAAVRASGALREAARVRSRKTSRPRRWRPRNAHVLR